MAQKWGNAHDPAANSRRWRRTLRDPEAVWWMSCTFLCPLLSGEKSEVRYCRVKYRHLIMIVLAACGSDGMVCLELPQDAWHITAS